MIPSPSAIRLAVLASQKELVDLDKWLSINLNTYKDFFFEVISTVLAVNVICWCHTIFIDSDHEKEKKNILICIVQSFRSVLNL